MRVSLTHYVRRTKFNSSEYKGLHVNNHVNALARGNDYVKLQFEVQ